MTQPGTFAVVPLPSPTQARRVFDRLEGRRETIQKTRDDRDRQRQDVAQYLAVADDIKVALEAFSEQLFSSTFALMQPASPREAGV